MKNNIILIIIAVFIINLTAPISGGFAAEDYFAAGADMQQKSDVFFTGFASLMMKLAIDIVSDGSNLPAPAKKQGKNEKSAKKQSPLSWNMPTNEVSSGFTSKFVSDSSAGIGLYSLFLKIRFDALARILLMLHLFILFSISLIYSLPRGDTGEAIMNETRAFYAHPRNADGFFICSGSFL